MKNIFKNSGMILILILALITKSYGLEVETHKAINEYIANNGLNGFSLDSYLKSNLGMQAGKTEKFGTKTVWEWLRDGGEYEDDPTSSKLQNLYISRYTNHFHNPIAPTLESAGFSGIWNTGFKSGVSAILWSQKPVGTQNLEGNYSWHDARDYYYKALTSPNKDTRSSYFAETFRGIGQLMHLVHDMSVPEHTRNDGHYLPAYEAWVKNTQSSKDFQRRAIFDTALANPIFFNMSRLRQSSAFINDPTPAPVPVANLFDTNQYNGNNPDVTVNIRYEGSNRVVTPNDKIGFSEFTNANFLSWDTLFTNFAYPSQIGAELWTDKSNNRNYFKKTAEGVPVDHLAVSSFLYPYRVTYFPQYTGVVPFPLGLDSKVYSDYASHLLPRAVGYSAGLLNYFFRGKLDMIEEGAEYRIENLSDEEMTGNISSFRLFYDDTSGNRQEMSLSFFDAFGNQITDANTQISISAKGRSAFTVRFDPPSIDPKSFLLVFNGRLGNEENAVVGSIIGRLYLMVMPVDHGTREILESRFFTLNFIKGNTLASSSQSELPFAILDDAAYWDTETSTWSKTKSSDSLGVPLGTGGPQYMAKRWDEQNRRLRFVPNLSYEKEAYHPFTLSPKDPVTGQLVKDINYLTYIGSPLFSFGMYNENTGWMEYTDTGIMTIQPTLTDPQQRTFPLYKGVNFNDVFVETPSFKVYNFDGSRYETVIPKDPDAPTPSIVGAYKPEGGDYVKVSVPKVFDAYVKPNPYWNNSPSTGSSGLDYYRFQSNTAPTYENHEAKCIFEDNDCGSLGGSSVKTVFDIPYNFNSFVRVHRNDNGQYYEELYINGQPVETMPASTERLAVHYQILAVYKDTAVVRKTDYISESESPLPYQLYTQNIPAFRIYEKQRTFRSNYFIYAKGKRYDLTGTTDITSRYLYTPYEETPEPGTTQRVDYLTYEYADDITGYHMDRIFISDSSESGQILVAFDEYAYNNGKGLVHTRKYEPGDSDQSKHILYYDIPVNEIQNADHEAARTGRKLLLFRSDGTFKQSLSGPIGLDKTIGSIGILN